MATIAEVVAAYLAARDWPSEEDDGVFAMPVAGEAGAWVAYLDPLDDQQQLLVYSVPDVDVPRARLADVALYLTRANFGLAIGNFEMDLDSGDIRFKTSVDVEGGVLTEAMVDHLVLANVVTTDRYLPGLRAVAQGADPAGAVAEVERADLADAQAERAPLQRRQPPASKEPGRPASKGPGRPESKGPGRPGETGPGSKRAPRPRRPTGPTEPQDPPVAG